MLTDTCKINMALMEYLCLAMKLLSVYQTLKKPESLTAPEMKKVELATLNRAK